MAKSRPKTGEPRIVHQPMKIDKLPPIVHEAICTLYTKAGKTWQEIEDLSAEPYGEGKLGFVDWMNLPTAVLELFPGMRIPRTNLHRWYDVRVAQVGEETNQRSAVAREVAHAFAAAEVTGDREASIHALRDVIFGMMSEAHDIGTRSFLTKSLAKLAEVQQKALLNELRGKKVDAEIAKSVADKARFEAEAGNPREIYMLAAQNLLKKLRTRKNVRAVIDPIKNELIEEIAHGAEAFAKQIEQAAA